MTKRTKTVANLVKIPADSLELEGMLEIPANAGGIVIFAHGSGSSRLSPRNNFVAKVMRENGLGTLLFDLLTPEEDEIYRTRFNIDLLTERLVTATEWLLKKPEIKKMKLGYFGASTGAAAAIVAAAKLDKKISAVVSRGGRPDLAGENTLKKVKAATLLIVGSHDYGVIELNQEAYKLIDAEKEISYIGGATHLFEEPGALEQVADLAAEWFKKFLA